VSQAEEVSAGPIILDTSAGGRVEVLRHGAQVVRWTDAAGGEVLYLSPRSRFGAGARIRGGIPVVFPQFAEQGPLPKHGIVRTAEWELEESGTNRAVLRLADSADRRAVWDHAFEAELRVELSDELTVTLSVINTGEDAFDFTAALHSYLHVGDIHRTAVHGLGGVRFRDKVLGGQLRVQETDELRFDSETDRIYLDAPDEVWVRDEAEERTVVVTKRGFPDAVVWNPWAELAARTEDLGEDQYPRFVCVEAAQAGTPARLEPGARWEGAQTISITR